MAAARAFRPPRDPCLFPRGWGILPGRAVLGKATGNRDHERISASLTFSLSVEEAELPSVPQCSSGLLSTRERWRVQWRAVNGDSQGLNRLSWKEKTEGVGPVQLREKTAERGPLSA